MTTFAPRRHKPRAERRANALTYQLASIGTSTPQPRDPAHRFVCRDHQDTHVDHRGRGCPTCTYSRSLTRRQRRAARINGEAQ